MTDPTAYLPPASEGMAARTDRLAGRVAIVIGAGQDDRGLPPDDQPAGNGRAISLTLAGEGAHVICADNVLQRSNDTVALIAGAGGSAEPALVDAADESDVAALFAVAMHRHRRIDVVIANVGIGGPQWLAGTTAPEWDRCFATNTRSHFLACKYGLQHMKAGGAIVLVSSIAALRPGSRMPVYDASKAALAGLMRHAAMEAQPRAVRVNVVAPGLIDTPIGREATRARPNRLAGTLPLGRQGTAWEVANAVLFLCSDESAYVTGQMLAVDGGRSII